MGLYQDGNMTLTTMDQQNILPGNGGCCQRKMQGGRKTLDYLVKKWVVRNCGNSQTEILGYPLWKSKAIHYQHCHEDNPMQYHLHSAPDAV